MKTTSLFRLGGIALLLSAIMFGIDDLMYFLSGEQPLTILGLWIGICGTGLRVLGMFALFARQSERGGILGLIGFVLVVLGNIAVVGSETVQLGVTSGAISSEQVAQVTAYALGDTVLGWLLVIGEIVFGISIYRAQVFPKYAGAVLALVGVLHYLTGVIGLTQPIYAILSVLVYAWLGWVLMRGNSTVSGELAPAPAT